MFTQSIQIYFFELKMSNHLSIMNVLLLIFLVNLLILHNHHLLLLSVWILYYCISGQNKILIPFYLQCNIWNNPFVSSSVNQEKYDYFSVGYILRLERKYLSTMGHSEAPARTRKPETLTDCRGWPESMRCSQWWHLMTHKESSLEPLTGTTMPLLQIGWGKLRRGSNLPWPQQRPYFCAKKWKLNLPEVIRWPPFNNI